MTDTAIEKLRRLFHTTRLTPDFQVKPELMAAVFAEIDGKPRDQFVAAQTVTMGDLSKTEGGMTLREHYAGLAMQALVTSAPATGAGKEGPTIVALTAVIMADTLIKALSDDQ